MPLLKAIVTWSWLNYLHQEGWWSIALIILETYYHIQPNKYSECITFSKFYTLFWK